MPYNPSGQWFDNLSYELPEGARLENIISRSALSESRFGMTYSNKELLELGRHIDELPDGTTPDEMDHIVKDRRTPASLIDPFPRRNIVCRIPPEWFDLDTAERALARHSFSGAQDKFTAVLEASSDNEFTLRLPDRRREIGNVIVKPYSMEYAFQPENEYLSMRIMELCGFDAARTVLFRAKTDDGVERLHLCVERFDLNPFRASPTAPVKRNVKQVAELMDLPSASGGKYALSTEELFYFVGNILSADETSEFTQRYFFGYILGNGDMHAKNFSMIRHGDEWTSAPVYDMMNTSAYGLEHRLCLPLGERAEYSPSPDPFVLVDFLSDYLGNCGFERMHARLLKLSAAAIVAMREISETVDMMGTQNPKTRIARFAFLENILNFVNTQAEWFLKHIERYYLDGEERTEVPEHGR